ncbi:hypothetical protein ACPA9J_14595 [Pseudomonas aeruginosa]
MDSHSPIATVAQALRRAERILVITGAGLSADSGMPTYRGLGGLYNGRTEEGSADRGGTFRTDAAARSGAVLGSTRGTRQGLPGGPDPTPATKPSPSCRSTSRNAGC